MKNRIFYIFILIIVYFTTISTIQAQIDPLSPEQISQLSQKVKQIKNAQGEEETPALTNTLDEARENQEIKIPDSATLPEIMLSETDKIRHKEDLILSPIEKDYQERIDNKITLTQFGYDIFATETQLDQPIISGSIPDDYILGIGDELVVTLRGTDPKTFRVKVDREGQVIIPNLPPISAVGKRFSEFQKNVKEQVDNLFIGTDIYISLGKLKTVSVLMIGHVNQPGLKQLTGLSTVLDALFAAKGVKKSGSLRNIQIIRQNEKIDIDLYPLLLGQNVEADMLLQQGDRIIIPSIGHTIGLIGDVNQPGIYELAPNATNLSTDEFLQNTGGLLRPTGNRFHAIYFNKSGKQTIQPISPHHANLYPGSILIVEPNTNILAGQVRVKGHVQKEMRYSLSASKTIADLIPDREILKPDPYTLFAVLQRIDPQTRIKEYKAINLENALNGMENTNLRNHDELIILGFNDIYYLASEEVQDILHGEKTEKTKTSERNCAGLSYLSAILASSDLSRFAHATHAARLDQQLFKHINDDGEKFSCPFIYNEYPELLPFVLEHVILLNGEVHHPGVYPIAGNTNIAQIITAAKGLTQNIDETSLELSRFQRQGNEIASTRQNLNLNESTTQSISLSYGDVLRFHQTYSEREVGFVSLTGEVLRPGKYEIKKGEKLSELLTRAGGLTENAYPYGTIFTRVSIKHQQKEGIERVARELKTGLMSLAKTTNASKGDVAATLKTAESMIQALTEQEPVGRMVVEADPNVLQVKPELDLILQSQDAIFIPKRPSQITITGSVLNSGSQQFIAAQQPLDYINAAGGFQEDADEDRTFVIYPDGKAEQLSLSSWNFTSYNIPPGSVIVVPQDLSALDFWTVTKDLTQILGQVAISAASIAVISDKKK